MTTTTPNPLEQVLSIQEAAALVGRHENTIRFHLVAGVLPGRCLGGGFRGVWIVDRAALLEYYRARPKDVSLLTAKA
jgi:hypothetical protein